MKRKHRYLNKCIFNKILMSAVILISATVHIALDDIYNYLHLLPILYFFPPLQAPQQVLALSLEKWPTPSSLMYLYLLSPCLHQATRVSH